MSRYWKQNQDGKQRKECYRQKKKFLRWPGSQKEHDEYVEPKENQCDHGSKSERASVANRLELMERKPYSNIIEEHFPGLRL